MKTDTYNLIFVFIILVMMLIAYLTTIILIEDANVKMSCIEQNMTYIKYSYPNVIFEGCILKTECPKGFCCGMNELCFEEKKK